MKSNSQASQTLLIDEMVSLLSLSFVGKKANIDVGARLVLKCYFN